jgi:hypothetical protein
MNQASVRRRARGLIRHVPPRRRRWSGPLHGLVLSETPARPRT